MTAAQKRRPVIAFFDYCDVFEEFYSHYGVTQRDFAISWDSTGSHAFAKILQSQIGDVIWYEFSVRPEFAEDQHRTTGCRVKMIRSGLLHRTIWKLFYGLKFSWRYRGLYLLYATIAPYLVPLSFAFRRAIRKDRPDLIFVQDYAHGRFDFLWLLSRMLRTPVVAWHSGSLVTDHRARFVRRFTLPRADRVIVSSEREREILAKTYGVLRDRQDVILTPLDIETYRPLDRDACLRETGLRADRRYLLFVGRLDDRIKRISAIIRAMPAVSAQVPAARLLIVGSGLDREKLEALAGDIAPGLVTFIGWVGDPGVKAYYYNVAEALLLPSVQEGFPTVVGEAMLCGTPAIASDVGGSGELVCNDITGALIPPGDEAALRETILQTLTGTERGTRSEVRQAALSRLSPAVVGEALRVCLERARAAYDR